MKIGDEVYIHGYVDEIRKDVVIIRNEGGYFGTISGEIVRKSEVKTLDKWVKDYLKTEPREYPCNTCANKGDHNGECSNCVADSESIRWKTPSHYKPKTKLQPRCPKCGVRGYIRSLESMGVKLKKSDEYKWTCTNCNKYFREEPKDEPQTMDTFAIDMAIAKCKARHNNCKNCDKTCMWRNEPQTEDAYAYDEDDWYDKAERESE